MSDDDWLEERLSDAVGLLRRCRDGSEMGPRLVIAINKFLDDYDGETHAGGEADLKESPANESLQETLKDRAEQVCERTGMIWIDVIKFVPGRWEKCPGCSDCRGTGKPEPREKGR